MRTHTKPIIALASGAVLASSLICQSAHAQSAILPVASNNANDALTVNYTATSVADPNSVTSELWTYTYSIVNPSTDPGFVTSFEVGFDAVQGPDGTPGDTVVTGSIKLGGVANGDGTVANGVSVTWSSGLDVTKGTTGPLLSFQSDYGPQLSTAGATGFDGPWSSSENLTEGQPIPTSQEVYVPVAVPEPAITSLLSLALLLFPFRSSLFKK